MLEKLKKFIAESRQELRHINWPTRAEAIRLTSVVIILSLVLAALLGAFDYLFAYLLRVFILKA